MFLFDLGLPTYMPKSSCLLIYWSCHGPEVCSRWLQSSTMTFPPTGKIISNDLVMADILAIRVCGYQHHDRKDNRISWDKETLYDIHWRHVLQCCNLIWEVCQAQLGSSSGNEEEMEQEEKESRCRYLCHSSLFKKWINKYKFLRLKNKKNFLNVIWTLI